MPPKAIARAAMVSAAIVMSWVLSWGGGVGAGFGVPVRAALADFLMSAAISPMTEPVLCFGGSKKAESWTRITSRLATPRKKPIRPNLAGCGAVVSCIAKILNRFML